MKRPPVKSRNRGTAARSAVVAAMLIVVMIASLSVAGEIRARLRRIRQEEIQGRATPRSLERIEEGYMDEYRSAKTQGEKLLICKEMLRLHVNAGMPNLLKIEEYTARALEHVTSSVDRCELLVGLGDARVAIGRRDRARAVPRAQCIGLYVEAWQDLRQYADQEKFQELPTVDLFDGPGDTNDPIYKIMAQQHEKQVLDREEVKLQNRVLRLRRRLLEQVRSLYSPAEKDALTRDVRLVTAGEGLVRDILEKLESEEE